MEAEIVDAMRVNKKGSWKCQNEKWIIDTFKKREKVKRKIFHEL